MRVCTVWQHPQNGLNNVPTASLIITQLSSKGFVQSFLQSVVLLPALVYYCSLLSPPLSVLEVNMLSRRWKKSSRVCSFSLHIGKSKMHMKSTWHEHVTAVEKGGVAMQRSSSMWATQCPPPPPAVLKWWKTHYNLRARISDLLHVEIAEANFKDFTRA